MENKYFVYYFKAENQLVTNITGYHADSKEEAYSIFEKLLHKISQECNIKYEDIDKIRENYFHAFYDKQEVEIEVLPVKYMYERIVEYGKEFDLIKSENNTEDKEFAFIFHCADFKLNSNREFSEISDYSIYK